MGLTAVFFTGWSPFAETAGVDAIKNDACRKLIYDCDKEPSDIAVVGLEDVGVTNLQDLCDIYYDTGGDSNACRRICGCT